MPYKYIALIIERIDGLRPVCDVLMKRDHIVISIKGDKKLYDEPHNLCSISERLQKGDVFAEPAEFEFDGKYGPPTMHAMSWMKYTFRFADNYLQIIESFYDLSSAIEAQTFNDPESDADLDLSHDTTSTDSTSTSTDARYVSTKTKTTEIFITKSIRLDLETCVRKISSEWAYQRDEEFKNDDGCSII
jgi:hypothetical protein